MLSLRKSGADAPLFFYACYLSHVYGFPEGQVADRLVDRKSAGLALRQQERQIYEGENMRQAIWVFLLVATMALQGCKQEKLAVEGNWKIELEPMLQQARELGASPRGVQQIRETFVDGRMAVDGKQITLTIPGFPDSEVFEYKLSSKEGQCFNLAIEARKTTLKYCVDAEKLEVHDPSTKLVTVYSKV
jgi:hypothetical protein